tara:strand:- start:10377 stop:10883 length:507 start_codon:yes stop_codon:yes gene_type:complete
MDNLIEKHMGLILTIVNRFNPKNQTEKEEYIQAGRIGLWKALTKFSVTGGSKFSPYAWNPIKWEIIKEIRSTENKHHIEFAGSGKDIEDYQNKYVNNKAFSKGYYINKDSELWEILPSSLSTLEEATISLKSEGYNFKEISNKLNLDRSKIKKIFDSAVNKIREHNNE